MGTQYMEEGFHETLKEVKMRVVGLILEGVIVGDNISLKRGSTTNELKIGLAIEVIEETID